MPLLPIPPTSLQQREKEEVRGEVKEGTVPGGGQVEAQLQTEGEAGETKTHTKKRKGRHRESETPQKAKMSHYKQMKPMGWGRGGA